MRILLLALSVVLMTHSAAGHETATGWTYPQECCGGNDCDKIDAIRVRIVVGGYLIDGKHFMPESKVRKSQDDDYHACFWPQPDNLYCFFVPPSSS